MKIKQLFTARYSDGRMVFEKSRTWIKRNMNGANVKIEPTVSIWQAESNGVYFVDYNGKTIGCTVSACATLEEAEEIQSYVQSMTQKEFKEWLIRKWEKMDKESEAIA